MNKEVMIQTLRDKAHMWAYERGHSAGIEEVKLLEDAYLFDLEDIFEAIANY